MKTIQARKTARRFGTGDRVYKYIAGHRINMEVVEDRGDIGLDGEQVLRVRDLISGIDPDQTHEVSALDVRKVRGSDRRNGIPRKHTRARRRA